MIINPCFSSLYETWASALIASELFSDAKKALEKLLQWQNSELARDMLASVFSSLNTLPLLRSHPSPNKQIELQIRFQSWLNVPSRWLLLPMRRYIFLRLIQSKMVKPGWTILFRVACCSFRECICGCKSNWGQRPLCKSRLSSWRCRFLGSSFIERGRSRTQRA